MPSNIIYNSIRDSNKPKVVYLEPNENPLELYNKIAIKEVSLFT